MSDSQTMLLQLLQEHGKLMQTMYDEVKFEQAKIMTKLNDLEYNQSIILATIEDKDVENKDKSPKYQITK